MTDFRRGSFYREQIEKNSSDSFWFCLIFCVSMAVRAVASCTSFAQIYPDEIYQTVEMAHKLAFGKAITYWEFRVGARSWFLPGILAGVYKILDFFGVKNALHLNIGIKLFFSLLHSLSIGVFYLILRNFKFSKGLSFLFSLPLAVSYFLAYVSVRTLSESASLPFMVFAVYFAVRYVDSSENRHLFWSFFMSGIAFMIRFQNAVFALGLALALFLASKNRFKAALVFGFGYIGMMLLQGLLDLFTWGKFMQSFLTYLDYNILQKFSDRTGGVSPWFYYLADVADTFHPITYISAVLLLILSVIHFGKLKKVIVFALPFILFFAVHSAIGHKQPRFVFASYFALIALSSAAFAFVAARVSENRRFNVVVISLMLLLSLGAVPYKKYLGLWNNSFTTETFADDGSDRGKRKRFSGILEIASETGQIKDLKRAFIFGIPQIWCGGYAYFHRNVPLLYSSSRKEFFKSLDDAGNADWKNSYFVIKKDFIDEKALKSYKLTKIKDAYGFSIYRLETKDFMKRIPLAGLPEKTENRTKWNHPENIVMSRSGVLVDLEKEYNSAKIEIALDSSDSYEISFLKDGRQLGKLTVLPEKKRFGMYTRKRSIPQEIREAGFDSLLIVPLEHDDACSLGSIKLD
ncbi:glycosyltransferase family 39 protein [bacterium]|nr:glycosyltransferase family 39 protein [bacterium]